MYQENISCMCLLTKREGRHAVSLFVCFFFLPFSEITGFFFSQFVSCKAEEGWSSQPKCYTFNILSYISFAVVFDLLYIQ